MGTGEPIGHLPTPGRGFRVRHRVVAVRIPACVPGCVDGYDEPDFAPAMRALLEMLRKDAGDSASPDISHLIREEMPADMKALLLTVAFRGETALQLPIGAAKDVHLDSSTFGFPATDADFYYLHDAEGGRYFAPDGLEADYMFTLGSTPDGEIQLMAAWNEGDRSTTFGTCTYGGYVDAGASRIGDIDALLGEVVDWIDEVDEADAEWTEQAREWIRLARSR
jgi:hypothetical protein